MQASGSHVSHNRRLRDSYAVPCPMPDSAKKTAVLISIYVNTIKHKITELESSTRTRTFIELYEVGNSYLFFLFLLCP